MSKKLTLLILVLSFGFCAGCTVNPITGKQQFMIIPSQQDPAIGKKYAPEVEKQLGGKIANQHLQNYIDNIGQKLVGVSHKPHWQYHFIAVEDKSVNALALPGGYIFITKGMLKELTTEAQLAAVLAHEITHIVARHSSAAMSRKIGIGILLSAVTSEQTSQTVSTVANLTRQILGLRYSRSDEREADLAGLDYLAAAGYDPYAMVEIMKILQSQQSTRPIQFLSTHPAPQNRLTYLIQKIQTKYPNRTGLKIQKEAYHSSILEQLDN